jgi:hypothetical protein
MRNSYGPGGIEYHEKFHGNLIFGINLDKIDWEL